MCLQTPITDGFASTLHSARDGFDVRSRISRRTEHTSPGTELYNEKHIYIQNEIIHYLL